MKKFVGLFIFMLVLSGCTAATGNYEPGTYFTAGEEHTFYGSEATYRNMATLVVDENGFIAGVSIDASYKDASGNYTTKRILKDEYGMAQEEGQLEWYEQADKLADKIITDQGTDSIIPDADGYIDSIAGVTITVDEYIALVNDLLAQAEK